MKRLLFIVAACFLFWHAPYATAAIFSQPSKLATSYSFTLKTNEAILYKQDKNGMKKVGKLLKGQKPFCTAGTIQSKWLKINIGAENYYVSTQNIQFTKTGNACPKSSTKGKTLMASKTNVFVYKSKNFQEPIGIVNEGTTIGITEKQGEWYSLLFAGQQGYIHEKQLAGLATEVPIIVYHHLLKEKENKKYRNMRTVVSVEEFEKQMKLLHDYGYHTITLRELEQFVHGEIDLPAKSIMIHFDDGLKTNYVYAYPTLKKYGLHAAAFLITSRNSRPLAPFDPDDYQFLHWTEIAQMKDVFEFASHTHALHNLGSDGIGNLVKESPEVIWNDFMTSRQLLDHTTYFTYPFGQYTDETIRLLKETGFTMAFTTKIGTVKPGDDPYQLKRVGVEPDTTIEQFKKMIRVVE
ncbi:MAG: polysaccharide deacetylase family protein [Anoxybacillus ayderensis]|nr:polysaccharide deacetylase family protein [Anoxybacillus ayderensis]